MVGWVGTGRVGMGRGERRGGVVDERGGVGVRARREEPGRVRLGLEVGGSRRAASPAAALAALPLCPSFCRGCVRRGALGARRCHESGMVRERRGQRAERSSRRAGAAPAVLGDPRVRAAAVPSARVCVCERGWDGLGFVSELLRGSVPLHLRALNQQSPQRRASLCAAFVMPACPACFCFLPFTAGCPSSVFLNPGAGLC